MTPLKVLAAVSFIPALLVVIALYQGVKIEALREAGIKYLVGLTVISILWFVARGIENWIKKTK
jgi:hypothetical protein